MPIRQRRPFIDTFVEDFQESLLSSPIQLADVIPWEKIESAVETKADTLPVIEDENDPEEFLLQEFVRDGQARHRCEILFELLRFRNKRLVSREATWELTKLDFSDLDSIPEEQFAANLEETGAHRILQSRERIEGHIEQYEINRYSQSHHRADAYFEHQVVETLREIASEVAPSTSLVSEERLRMPGDNNSRAFDLILYKNDQPQVVFEISYFQGPGSRPSELSRSFDRLSTKLRNQGIEFVWITDGDGWVEMENVLEEAYKNIVDIYSYEQMKDLLEEDIQEFLRNGPAVSEDYVDLNPNTNLQDFE
ncbi:DpnII family type II restriction endonuclease [Halobacterium bonnevillei]|uniref:Restriction endonuclease type II DpnII-like domain-containing protein n=1 Tax=Halobacterium bonnevillei TaxID=2692200 RepID=A0A6B0SCX7_9EURY|nr:DpnII family type II restriction endonuclease [Halobacterium bonnevillei]MXR19238.1 hypothetical protein [Halobacterium bonnevillei]